MFFPETIFLLKEDCFEGILNPIKIDGIVSDHLSCCNTHQYKIIANFLFWFLVTPTGKTSDAMAMKYYAGRQLAILLLHIYGFEGYSSQYKLGEMVNNHLKCCK